MKPQVRARGDESALVPSAELKRKYSTVHFPEKALRKCFPFLRLGLLVTLEEKCNLSYAAFFNSYKTKRWGAFPRSDEELISRTAFKAMGIVERACANFLSS